MNESLKFVGKTVFYFILAGFLRLGESIWIGCGLGRNTQFSLGCWED